MATVRDRANKEARAGSDKPITRYARFEKVDATADEQQLDEQLAKVLGPSPVLLPKKLKTKHLHVTDHCLATTELAREVALLRTNWE